MSQKRVVIEVVVVKHDNGQRQRQQPQQQQQQQQQQQHQQPKQHHGDPERNTMVKTLAILPSTILVDHVASFLRDRKTWNALSMVNKEVNQLFKQHQLQLQRHLHQPDASKSTCGRRPWPKVRFRVGAGSAWSVVIQSSFVACGTDQGKIQVWFGDTGISKFLPGHRGRVNALKLGTLALPSTACHDDHAYSPVDKSHCPNSHYHFQTTKILDDVTIVTVLLSAADDKTIRLWNYQTWECMGIIHDHTSAVLCIEVWSSNDSDNHDEKKKATKSSSLMVASAGVNQKIMIHQITSSVLYSNNNNNTNNNNSTCPPIPKSNNKEPHGSIHIECLQILSGTHTGPIHTLLKMKNVLLSGSSDERLCIWSLGDHVSNDKDLSSRPNILLKNQGGIQSLDCYQDYLAVGCGNMICLFQQQEQEQPLVVSFQPWKTLKGHDHKIRSVAFSPNGQYIASACTSGNIRIWRPNDGICIRKWSAHQHFLVCAVAYCGTNNLVSAGSDGMIALWEV